MQAKAFHISVQGASHIKKNKECQDASRSFCDERVASIFLRLREIPSDIVRIIVYLNAYQDKEMPAVDFGMSEFIRVRLENCDLWRNLPENLSERDREVTSTIVQWEVTKPTDKSTVIHLAEFSKVNSCWELQFDGTPLPANVKIKNVLRNHGAKF